MARPSAFEAFTARVRVEAGKLNETAARRALVEAAVFHKARVIREQSQRAGIAPLLTQYVDGREDAPFASAKPDSTILLEWDYSREIAHEAVRLLRDAGPQVRGDWKKSIAVFADDAEVDPEGVPHGAHSIEIMPTVIYARYLERVENFSAKGFGLVAHVALDLRALYREVAKVSFTYRTIAGDTAVVAAAKKRGGKAEPMRYPTIAVKPI
jgi:hypothetical protein